MEKIDRRRFNSGKNPVPLIQLDYYTKEEIGRYRSINEAALDNYVTPKDISSALKLRGGVMKRSKLMFKVDGDRKDELIQTGKSILQLDYETGETIREFNTIAEAAKANYVTDSAISRALIERKGIMKRSRLRFELKK